MSDKEYVNEKKKWLPMSMHMMDYVPTGMKQAVYFGAIEELEGAWINDKWEEADAFVEEWEEDFVDGNGKANVKIVRRETKRPRRYVLKRFLDDGFVENVHTSNGPRRGR